jgi:Ca2+-binding EF-hand superfamily protein
MGMGLMGFILVGCILFSLATLAFLTQSALTKKDVQLLKSELKPHAETTTVNRKQFVDRFMSYTSLTLSQLDQAFDVIDTDRDGKIDGTDIRAFATVSTGVKVGKMHEEGQQAVEKIFR